MSIRFVSGDLFDYKAFNLEAISQGLSVLGISGAGLALEIRRRYPKCFEKYRELCSTYKPKLGTIMVYDAPDGICVFNLMTQPDIKHSATVEAIKEAMHNMVKYAKETGIKVIGVPRIGAGLGGLAWKDVKAMMIQEFVNEEEVELIVFETVEIKK